MSDYALHHPELIPSPGLVAFLPLVKRNIQQMCWMARDPVRLRPHCKTHKMPGVVQLLLAAGVTKHKAATLAEAEMLAQAGVRDIVLAYNLVGPNIARAVEFCRKYPEVDFAATADDREAIEQLGDACRQAGVRCGLLVDINPGRDRTGALPGPVARELATQIANQTSLNFAGFHVYDGHHQQADRTERRAAVEPIWHKLLELRDTVVAAGIPVPRLVCGGTPTFPVFAEFDDPALELSPGTCIFHDAGYRERFPDMGDFTPALLVLTRVVSRPTAERVTFDLGSKAIASDPPMGQRLEFPDLPDARQVLQNEEHLVVETEHANRLRPGDWLLAIPRHVCPTSALHAYATVVDQGEVVGVWPTVARDRKLTI